MKARADISIIVPFLNEEENISSLGRELNAFSEAHPELELEFILVNDGSTDSSRKLIGCNPFPPRTQLINLSRNFGSHAALRAGITRAGGRFVTFIYADLQDPLDNVLALYQKISCGCKSIAWAFRRETANRAIERYFSGLYSGLMRKYVNRNYPNQGFDVVMFDEKVAAELNRNIEANSSIFLQILNLGFKSDHIYYDKRQRKKGRTKWTIAKKIKLLIDSFVGFSFAPIRLVSIIGIVFFIAGLLWSTYIIFRKLAFNDLASGWPALLCVLMVEPEKRSQLFYTQVYGYFPLFLSWLYKKGP